MYPEQPVEDDPMIQMIQTGLCQGASVVQVPEFPLQTCLGSTSSHQEYISRSPQNPGPGLFLQNTCPICHGCLISAGTAHAFSYEDEDLHQKGLPS